MKPSISAIIIAKNEAHMIGPCIDTLGWCDEIVVIDDGSSDGTNTIAEKKGARVVTFKHASFARKREEGMKRAKHDWIFYIDADERVLPTLAKEIMVHVETGTAQALNISRENIFYGTQLQFGGWGSDRLDRVFNKATLSGWKGDIHESAEYTGTVKQLNTPLIHLSHRDTISGLYKSAEWTPMEADALVKGLDHKVTILTILRKGVFEFIRRGFLKKGYKDGQVGLVEAIIQGINRMLVYIQVWEQQQKPSIQDKYSQKEADIKKMWEAET